mgnify:CR=1 FL=1
MGSGQGQSTVNRYECKYFISPQFIPQVRDFIRHFTVPDRYCQGTPPEYAITTLQLDTPAFAFHNAKVDDYDARIKLRVRTYNEIGSAPVFAEIKGKFRDNVIKTRTVIPFSEWNSDLVYSTCAPTFFKSHQQELDFYKFRRIVWETQAHPSLLIRYIRESYIGQDGQYLRITFDRQLEYCPYADWESFGVGKSWYPMDSAEMQNSATSNAILEIKTLQDVPTWIIDMVQTFNLQRSGNCKYSTGIWSEALFSPVAAPRESTLQFLAWST